MSTKDYYPAIRPALNINFTGSRMVDPRITFSRSGTGNVAGYFDEKGVMRFAPPNVPRIDFEPVTGECKGLLIEEQRTNLLTYSQQFNNAVWLTNTTSTKVTPNAAVAPNGLLVGTKISENDTSAVVKYVGNTSNVSVSDNAIVTATIYAKAAERSQIRIAIKTKDGTYAGSVFSLSTGEVVSATSGYSGLITAVGNGWFRCSVTGSVGAGTSTHGLYTYIANNNTSSYNGDGTSGIYIWGTQLEQGSFPTSYIPTASDQVTRAADAMSITGSNFSSFFNANEGAVVVESEYFGPNTADLTTTGIVTLSDGATNYFSIAARTDANSVRAVISTGLSITTVSNNYPRNTSKKIALAYKNNDFGFCIGGEDVYTDNTNQSNANINSLIIGAYYATTNRRLNGRIKRIAIYNRRIADVQLQALTA